MQKVMCAVVCLVGLVGLVCLSSTEVTGQDPEKPAPLAAKSSPEALALLDAAIRYQGPEAYAKPGAIKDLTVRLQSRVWDHSRSPAQQLQIGVRRFLRIEPEKFRSEWHTTNGTQMQGFDGRRYWYWDKDGIQLLIGETKADSRKDIRNEIDETKHLLRFFFLANLKGPTARFTLLPDETARVWGVDHECRVLHRENLDPESPEPPVSLWIDAKTQALVKAAAHAPTHGQKSLFFHFLYNEGAQPRVKGVLFPLKIEVREQPFGAEKDRISLIAVLEEDGGIEFNTGFDEKLFRGPR